MDIDTAKRHKAKVVFVVANNASWSIERNDQIEKQRHAQARALDEFKKKHEILDEPESTNDDEAPAEETPEIKEEPKVPETESDTQTDKEESKE